MALSVEAARQIEQELRTKAEILAYEIGNLVATDPLRARVICGEIVTLLQEAVGSDGELDGKSEAASIGRPPNLRLAASRAGGDEIEEFILGILAHSARGTLSVQEIFDGLEEAEIEIKRATLVVRLHRLVQAGKLASRTHGHYVLSDAEYDRRRST